MWRQETENDFEQSLTWAFRDLPRNDARFEDLLRRIADQKRTGDGQREKKTA